MCICIGEIKQVSKDEICIWKGKKHGGKGENAVYQHFLLFQQFFQILLPQGG